MYRCHVDVVSLKVFLPLSPPAEVKVDQARLRAVSIVEHAVGRLDVHVHVVLSVHVMQMLKYARKRLGRQRSVQGT